jgi:hypothetical protein
VASTSPHLENAERASAYFDRRRGDIGRWVSAVIHGNKVDITEHRTQRAAYEYIGGEGGSDDPYFTPPGNTPGTLVTKDGPVFIR